MNKWTPTPIKKIGRVVTGKTPPTSNSDHYGDGYMFVTPVDLHNNFIIESTAKNVTEQGLSTVKSNALNGLSILVGCIGWDMGNVALVNGPCVTNQQINSITDIKKPYNSYYVYYWLTLQKKMLFRIANVTRTPILNKTMFEDILVPMPDRATQDRIVSLLLPISRKIALNNRINAELERMARLAYEYLFQQSKKGELRKFGDIIHPNRVPFRGDNKTGLFGIDLSVMPSKTFCLNQKGSAEDFISNQFVMRKYDLLFGSIRPYLKKAGFAAFDGLANGTILNFRPKRSEDFAFALCTLTSEAMFQYVMVRSNGNGTRMPTIGTDEILDFNVNYDKDLAEKFGIQFSHYWKLISNNINENFALTEQRDFLLPLLMNGQVIVKKQQRLNHQLPRKSR